MIGIYGGTFDPIHHGHLRVAIELYERLGLSRVHLIPSARPPHRDIPSTPAELRFEMVQAAVENISTLVADDRELRRQGRSYMVDTLLGLRDEFGSDEPLCLLLCMDAFIDLHHWHRWTELIELAHIVIVQRPGSGLQLDDELKVFFERYVIDTTSNLRSQSHGHIFLQPTPELNISSTAIREMLASKLNPRYLLPDSVLELIHEHQLYY
ncbi:MAG: nicotinate-nucleotide adenylyltransferase [Pseudomonadota bacterium]